MLPKHIFYVQQRFFFENRAVYEMMWNNTVETGRPTDGNKTRCKKKWTVHDK